MAISDKLVAAAMKNLEKLLISKGLNAEGMISKFDFDGDGEIDLDEFDSGLEQLTGSRAPRSYLQPIFSAIDQDGSGKLSSNELMALLGIENETTVSSSSLIISNHVKDKYNGEYKIQSSKINGKDWYLNPNNCRLYFYNANEGGAPSWSLDDREQDGSNDWYGGGWTRVPADGNIPVGTRRFVGAGKINISAVEDDKQPEVSNEVVEENIGSNMIEDDMISRANKWTLELSEMLENSDSNENIDAIKADFDSRFEEEISQLPLVAQAPARAVWKMKSDALVTVAKTKLSNDNAKVVAGLGIAGAAIGAVSAINQTDKMNNADVELVPDIEQSPIEKEEISESIESSHNTPQVEVPDRVEIPEQISSEEWADEHEVEVPEKVDLPDRVSVTEPLSESFSDMPKEGSSVDVGISLDEIINQMNGARFLNEQRELISNYKGKNFDLSFRVNSVDRTFGIGISEEYRRGNTLNVTSESNEIEVRMRNDYDISDISPGREMSLKVSVVDWNSIRKKLVVNSV
tara:strand:- start:96 stop:1649 length:1554 start_codon:yes stop_codon:yes gene_type:complete